MKRRSRWTPDPLESAAIIHDRRSGAAMSIPGYRRVTLFVTGNDINIQVLGTNIWEVTQTVKAWLEHGDDDQDPSDDLSTRPIFFQDKEWLLTFRRSWISGFKIEILPGDEI